MDQTRRSPAVDAGPATNALADVTDSVPPSPDIDWQQRLAEQVADRRRRKALAEEIRRQFAVAWSAGLRKRHAAKLARRGGGRR